MIFTYPIDEGAEKDRVAREPADGEG